MRDGAIVVGVDPGHHVGVAWVDADGRLLASSVIDVAALLTLELPAGVTVALGNGTGMAEARRVLERIGAVVEVVDERASTLEGQRLYWRDHPPRGWRRLLPAGLRVPPRTLDDYAAYAIALRWLRDAQRSAGPRVLSEDPGPAQR